MLKRRAAGAVTPLWLRPTALRLTLLHRGTGLHRIYITHLHLSTRMLDQLLGHSFVEVRATRLGIRTAQQALACALLRTTQQATWLVFVSREIFVLYSLWQAAQRGESMTSSPCLRYFFPSPRAGQHRGVCQSKDGQNCPAPLNSADLSVFKREKGICLDRQGMKIGGESFWQPVFTRT